MKRRVLLAVSFGTSYGDSREKSIGAIEKALERAFPEYEVRRAFSSRIIIKILKEREGIEVDDVRQALEGLVKEGVDSLLLQPLYVINGIEYDNMTKTAETFRDLFETFSIGKPLLSSEEDYDEAVEIMAEETGPFREDKTAVILMGHGTEHSANVSYAKLEERFAARGYTDYLIGTVEAVSALGDIKARMKVMGAKSAVLLPFLIVAGDHVRNDMAGEKDSSWKNRLLSEEFKVECVLRGLGESEGIQRIFVRHAREASEAQP